MLWTIPQSGQTHSITNPTVTLTGHQRKVGHVLFHPTAENVLASTSGDYSVKLWDISKAQEKIELSGHTEIIQSVTYNWEGDLLATTCKDKVLRVFDVRSKQIAAQGQGNQGVKGSRVVWLGDSSMLATTGFSKTLERQVIVWDTKNLSTPVLTLSLDMSAGLLMPYYDKETSMLFLAGKGDGNIRYFEYNDNQLYLLSEFKSSDPQRGIGFLPKRACRVGDCEIARAYKVHPTMIEPISFTVPRKADGFQADLFPDCVGDQSALTADAFFSGETAKPILISLEKTYVPSTKVEFIPPMPNTVVNSIRSSSVGGEKDALVALQASYDALKIENAKFKNEISIKDLKIKELETQLQKAISEKSNPQELEKDSTNLNELEA
ncbi:Coronin-like protein crn1 [Coelomomyces lativittatus]|nr:Coronin-like protein crn1 [Coelomomyces lativittatus]KAJ1514688.1 Coronin-like protein crn1 [Coelomomyces lativittatus]